MEDLEMIKAFALIEGGYVKEVDGKIKVLRQYDFEYWEEYNPITDLSLNCALRDKYECEVCYRYKECAVWIESTWIKSSFESQNIPRAVIECILKSKGLWK